MNYNQIIAAVYHQLSNGVTLYPCFLEITGEDNESVEYEAHGAPLTGKGFIMLQLNEDHTDYIEIWDYDSYTQIGQFDTLTRMISFEDPYSTKTTK